jgi:hypothetical protein
MLTLEEHVRDEKWHTKVGKPEGNRPLEEARLTSEDDVRMDLKETEYEGVDWIHLAQDRDQ